MRSLNIELAPGTLLAVEGPNGAGKSTLLRALRKLHPATGAVLVDGLPVRSVEEGVRMFAYVSQQAGPNLPGDRVADHAQAVVRRLRLPASLAEKALLEAGLGQLANRHPMDLSVGERQRLAIAAATAHRPPVWLLDEPTRGMDATARRWLALHVTGHVRSGGVAVVATHDARFADLLANSRLRVGVEDVVRGVDGAAGIASIAAQPARGEGPVLA